MANIIEKIILLIAKSNLKPVNLKDHPLYKTYQEYQPILESCYKQAYYWHGTGRYHYKIKGDSKYEGVDTSETYDVLQSVIDSGGITPKLDPILDVNGKYINSISLTKYRMYGRGYALFNQYEKIDFQYTFGSVRFWYYFLASLQMLHGNLFKNIYYVYRYALRDKKFIDKSQTWMFTFRKNKDTFKWTGLNFYRVRSDIPHNYGMLFGIKEKGVNSFKFNWIIERFETRANNLIKLNDITHIEVPLARVKDTELKLKQNNIDIPVISIEIADLYCSQYSLEYLSGITK